MCVCLCLDVSLPFCMGFPDSSVVNNPPALQETPVGFLGREDPLEKGQDTHSSILGLPLWLNWSKICLHCESPGFGRALREGKGYPLQYSGLENSMDCTVSPWGSKELGTTERLHFHFSLSCIGEGNGNPLQCSCLEWVAISL